MDSSPIGSPRSPSPGSGSEASGEHSHPPSPISQTRSTISGGSLEASSSFNCCDVLSYPFKCVWNCLKSLGEWFLSLVSGGVLDLELEKKKPRGQFIIGNGERVMKAIQEFGIPVDKGSLALYVEQENNIKLFKVQSFENSKWDRVLVDFRELYARERAKLDHSEDTIVKYFYFYIDDEGQKRYIKSSRLQIASQGWKPINKEAIHYLNAYFFRKEECLECPDSDLVNISDLDNDLVENS